MDETSLGDVGERELIRTVLRDRYGGSESFGDDCASLAGPLIDGRSLVVTTDPCPTPVASLLGFSDLYYWGWLLATINLSDIAAAGALPIGLVTSLTLPNSTTLTGFGRLLDGIDECCELAGTSVIGGNLKEGSEMVLSATALGTCAGRPLSRRGASPGDAVLVLGDLGSFWAGYFLARREADVAGLESADWLANVLRPRAKTELGQRLQRARLVTACLDNSDGLFPSLSALGEASGVGFLLDIPDSCFSMKVLAIASALGVDPRRLALGWGDWQLIVTTRTAGIGAVTAAAADCGVPCAHVGTVRAELGTDMVVDGGAGRLMRLDSERFSKDSWFLSGLDLYIERMLTDSLVDVN